MSIVNCWPKVWSREHTVTPKPSEEGQPSFMWWSAHLLVASNALCSQWSHQITRLVSFVLFHWVLDLSNGATGLTTTVRFFYLPSVVGSLFPVEREWLHRFWLPDWLFFCLQVWTDTCPRKKRKERCAPEDTCLLSSAGSQATPRWAQAQWIGLVRELSMLICLVFDLPRDQSL